MKGAGDFVSNADHRAEKVIREELLRARPAYGFLGEEGEFGRVAVGYRADLLLLATNPLEDLAVLRAPDVVIARGRIAHRRDS